MEDFKAQYHGRTERFKRQSTESPAERAHKQPSVYRTGLGVSLSPHRPKWKRGLLLEEPLKEIVDSLQLNRGSQEDGSSRESGSVTFTKSGGANVAVEVSRIL